MRLRPHLSSSSVLYRSYRSQPRPSQASRLGRAVFLCFCVLATAGLVFLSYPQQNHAALAWIAWVPFVWGLFSIKRAWASFWYGWMTAFLFQAGLFYWVYYTCVHGGGLSVWLAGGAWLGLSALLAVQIGLWAACCCFLQRTHFLFPLLAACGFVTLEWLHQTLAFYGLGFPWIMLGYSQWNVPEVLQLAAYGGVYSISFVLILISALLGWALAQARLKIGVGGGLVAAGICVGLFVWGDTRLPLMENAAGRALQTRMLSVGLAQPNIDQYKKWDAAFEQEIVDVIAHFGQEFQGKDLSLIVWPESVLPGDLQEEPYYQLMEDISSKTTAHQLIGSSIEQEEQQYVGAFLMTPFVEDLQAYKKVKLVPFGEYVPLAGVLKLIFPQVDVLGQVGEFASGSRRQPLLRMGGIWLGSTICYEAIFPQLWRQQSRQGAQVFANLTNDAWFFTTAAPYQHLAANVLRAVETGRPVLRAANTGISAVIDRYGRVEQRTDLFTRTWLQAQVQVPSPDEQTFYVKYGDAWVWLCAVLFGTCLIFAMVFLYE